MVFLRIFGNFSMFYKACLCDQIHLFPLFYYWSKVSSETELASPLFFLRISKKIWRNPLKDHGRDFKGIPGVILGLLQKLLLKFLMLLQRRFLEKIQKIFIQIFFQNFLLWFRQGCRQEFPRNCSARNPIEIPSGILTGIAPGMLQRFIQEYLVESIRKFCWDSSGNSCLESSIYTMRTPTSNYGRNPSWNCLKYFNKNYWRNFSRKSEGILARMSAKEVFKEVLEDISGDILPRISKENPSGICEGIPRDVF